MKWITNISVCNFRAFGMPTVELDIPMGHHLLGYGENGSGKSSIFHALNHILKSSLQGEEHPFPRNLFAGENEPAFIKIEAKDESDTIPDQEYIVSSNPDNSNNVNPVLQAAFRVGGFLDYRKILIAHALDVKAGSRFNVFNLVVGTLLADHPIRLGANTTTVRLSEEYERIKRELLNNRSGSRKYSKAEEDLRDWNTALSVLLVKTTNIANRFLQDHFRNKLKINFNVPNVEISNNPNRVPRKMMMERIDLQISYVEKPINDYQYFLNEARLSAFSICLFLAAMKTYPVVQSDLRVIFLDDVFIGMDNGNRIPLLEIIKNEFLQNDDLERFQMFLLTYDRQWFRLAKSWLSSEKVKLECVELYVDSIAEDNREPDKPVLLNSNLSSLEFAKKYLSAKDYPAAANYLRKALEQELKRILPPQHSMSTSLSFGEDPKPPKLDIAVRHFKEFVQATGLNGNPFFQLETYKKIIFNPLSHDDLDTPHYKKELQDAILVIEALNSISVKQVWSSIDSLKFPFKLRMEKNVTREVLDYEIRLLENLRIVKEAGGQTKLCPCRCIVELRGIKTEYKSLDKVFEGIWVDCGYPAPASLADFYSWVKVSNRKHLAEIVVF